MNPEQLPSLFHRPLNWFITKSLRKRDLHCTRCKQPVHVSLPLPATLWDTLVECTQCGHTMSVFELGSDGSRSLEESANSGDEIIAKPKQTTIQVADSATERLWQIPEKGGCHFLLIFGTLWLSFCLVFTIIMIRAPGHNPIGAFAFIGLFYLVGLGVIYAGLRMTRTRHLIRLTPYEFIHERVFFDSTKRQTWPPASVRSVELVVFYTQNYQPIYGIEVRGDHGKIRFGSAMETQEKAWLCQELRNALGLTAEATEAPVTEPIRASQGVKKSIRIEQSPQHCTIAMSPAPQVWVLALVGAIFAGIGGFMLVKGLSFADGSQDGLFGLTVNLFSLIWCIGPLIALILGCGLMWLGLRLARTHETLIATPSQLTLQTRIGSQQNEEIWQAEAIRDIRLSRGLSSTSEAQRQQTSYQLVVVLSDRVRSFGSGQPQAALQSAAEALRATLGLSAPS